MPPSLAFSVQLTTDGLSVSSTARMAGLSHKEAVPFSRPLVPPSKGMALAFHWRITLTLILNSKSQKLEKSQRFVRTFQRSCSPLITQIPPEYNESLQVYDTFCFTSALTYIIAFDAHIISPFLWVRKRVVMQKMRRMKILFFNLCIRNCVEALLHYPINSSQQP